MNQDIHTHLEKLKTELSKLEPAVKHLQKADENANALIVSLSNLHNEFTDYLQKIEKSLYDANDKHQTQITTEIKESTIKLINVVESFNKSNTAQVSQIGALLNGYSEIVESSTRLIKKIDSYDFTSRLNKLDESVSAIRRRIGDTEKYFKHNIELLKILFLISLLLILAKIVISFY